MRKLLHLKTSLFANHGQSNQLADKFVSTLQAKHPAAEFVTRDLAADPVPHLDGMSFQA
jgi:FMN-dependent NADH-azoreductase